jgi:uncharacterized protein
MHKYTRYLKHCLEEDLQNKMVFVGGPRQVGKTTLAKKLLANKDNYLNWDDVKDRRDIVRGDIFNRKNLVVLDEIHKYRLWRTLIKGAFDKHFPDINFLITGSARLDHFRKGGDSLLGRYHYYRLHPFSLPELSKKCEKDLTNNLLKFGGFPEPLFAGNERLLKRWHNERIYRVIDQDIRDMFNIKEISNLDLLIEQIPSRVSSLLSIKSLAEDLQVSPHTVNSYLDVFENMYLTFRISPFGKERLKAIKKTQKIYFWDWSCLENKGARFENMVASHLLKYCHFHEDYNGDKMELRYIRDTEGREVDFVVIKNKKPVFMVECKFKDESIDPSLHYYKQRLKIPKVYQVHLGNKHYGNAEKDICVIPFNKFCLEENLV